MNLIGIPILLAVLFVVTCAPRRWAVIGYMAGVLFLTQGQQLQVFGFNLFAIRFVELAGFIRVTARGELTSYRLNSIDRALLILYIYATVVFVLRSSEGVAYHIGMMVDAFLCYFTFRGLIGGFEDFNWFLRHFLLLLIPFAALVVFESLTKYNLFTVMGGVTRVEDFMRGGRLRCQGSFRHPILLGTLGATFLPLYIAMVIPKGHRLLAMLGIFLCLVIVGASNSGGPASCVVVGVAGWVLWKWRTKMLFIRRAMVFGIISLGLVMKAPVWYLLSHVSDITGGGGWHRAFLIDTAFQHLRQWWFAGMPITDTVNWFAYSVPLTGGADMTNTFISFGVQSGLVAIALLIALLVCAYRRLGIALALLRNRYPIASTTEFMLWGVGVMLAVHIMSWLGISYFDQSYVVWFMQLAAISNLCDQIFAEEAKGVESAADEPAVVDDIYDAGWNPNSSKTFHY
jgi:hypothetical protein